MLLIITSTGNELLVVLTSMTLNDLYHPKYRFLVICLRLLSAAHTSRVNCDKIYEDRPRQLANKNCCRLSIVSWGL